jgi:hypothetical protein
VAQEIYGFFCNKIVGKNGGVFLSKTELTEKFREKFMFLKL